MKLILSVGHDEYGLSAEGLTSTIIWDGMEVAEREWPENITDAMKTSVAWKWETITGEPASSMPDADLEWENVYSFEGTYQVFEEALLRLIEDLKESPGADDGTFDYWPSGMRLALSLDDALGHPHHDEIEAVAKSIILDTARSDFAEELYTKIGLEPPFVPSVAIRCVREWPDRRSRSGAGESVQPPGPTVGELLSEENVASVTVTLTNGLTAVYTRGDA